MITPFPRPLPSRNLKFFLSKWMIFDHKKFWSYSLASIVTSHDPPWAQYNTDTSIAQSALNTSSAFFCAHNISLFWYLELIYSKWNKLENKKLISMMRMTKEMFSREHQLGKRKHFPEHVRVPDFKITSRQKQWLDKSWYRHWSMRPLMTNPSAT